jgi:hypothetical protein
MALRYYPDIANRWNHPGKILRGEKSLTNDLNKSGLKVDS